MTSKLTSFIDSIISGDEAAAKAAFHEYLGVRMIAMTRPKALAEAYYAKLSTALLEYTGEDSRIKLSPGGKVRIDGKEVGHIEEEDMMAPGYDPDKSNSGIIFVALNGAKAEFESPQALYTFLADRFLKNELTR